MWIQLLVFASLMGASWCFPTGENSTYRTPVILVPGDGGSQIYANYSNWDILCPGGDDWFLIWVNLKFLLPFTEYCLSRYFKLTYNSSTRRTYDQPDVRTRIEGWGNTSTVEYLDSRHYPFLVYYGALVDALVKKGYRRGFDIRGAPYDFRRAPNENDDFVPKMKVLVEETFRQTGGKRVMLLAHSMGNHYSLFFLRKMTAAWKKRFVRGFYAISAPLGGAVKSIRAETCGDAINSAVIFLGPIKTVLRSMPSTPFLFPRAEFWAHDEVIARRPGRNYTVANYRQLFEDMGFMDGWEMYKDTHDLIDPLWIPDVDELFCSHGVKVDTPAKLDWNYDFEFPTFRPKTISGDGDGTVNLRSLHACLRWPGVTHREYPKAKHVATLSDERVVRDIVADLSVKDRGAW